MQAFGESRTCSGLSTTAASAKGEFGDWHHDFVRVAVEKEMHVDLDVRLFR